jgi:hypothetical protein
MDDEEEGWMVYVLDKLQMIELLDAAVGPLTQRQASHGTLAPNGT